MEGISLPVEVIILVVVAIIILVIILTLIIMGVIPGFSTYGKQFQKAKNITNVSGIESSSII